MKNEFVVLKTGRNEFRKIDVNGILYLQADGNYTILKTINEGDIILTKNLKNSHIELNMDNYRQISRSIFVNIEKIKHYKIGRNSFVILDSGEKLVASPKYLKNMLKMQLHTEKA